MRFLIILLKIFLFTKAVGKCVSKLMKIVEKPCCGGFCEIRLKNAPHIYLSVNQWLSGIL